MFDLDDARIGTISAETMLWAEGEMYDFENETWTDKLWSTEYTSEDMYHVAYDNAIRDFREFVSRIHPADLAKYLDNWTPERLVQDYWLARNGYDSSLTNGDLGDTGTRILEVLESLTNGYGYSLYVTDNGERWAWE